MKHRSYSIINILGLAIGLACFIIIGIFLQYELSYDSYHPNSDRTYLVTMKNPGQEYMGSTWFGTTPIPVAQTISEEFPEIAYAANFRQVFNELTTTELESSERGISVGLDFFEIFSYKWIYGDPGSSFDDPNSIVLTSSIAKKFFGHKNPVGEAIVTNPDSEAEKVRIITGVIEDLPGNTNINFDYIITDRSTENYTRFANRWDAPIQYNFVNLKKGVQKKQFEAKLSILAQTRLAPIEAYSEKQDKVPSFHLFPLEDIHLKSGHINLMMGSRGNITYVYLFGAVAFLILFIASTNYMNLATARSSTRSKEVGVRKAIGAFRGNLILQFISEALVISFAGILVSLLIVDASLPLVSELTGRTLTSQIFLSLNFWGIIILIGLVVGILSGIYPAFFMSALKPADVLKGQKKGLRSKSFLRNTLVIGQFAVTIVLLIGSITVFKQLNFFNIKDTGMNRGQVVAVATNDPEVWNSFQTLETELLALPSITEVSTSQYNPVRLSRKISDIKWESKQVDDQLSAYVSPVGFNFVELLDIELIAGRSFSKELYKETSTDYLLNESAIRQLGWTREEAIGKSFSAWGNDGKIVGVVKDFNYLSLHHEIEPLVIYLKPNINQRMVLARINADNTQQTLAQLETIFTKFSAEGSFSHFFLDDSFKNQYRDDQRLSSFFNYFTLLAFLIAGLGLFGLTTFMIEQRKKEIGIRKVLGATLIQILLLLNKDFLRPIIFSFLLALPVGWYLSNQWLMGFAYKIDLSIWIFLSAGLITIFISLITVIWQSVKTALMNPIESLRIE